MNYIPVTVAERGFGQTSRRDLWWAQPLAVFLGFSTFIAYATWAAFQGNHYYSGPYLSPFYSPELFGTSGHAWFGAKPGWWPAFAPWSPAFLILGIPVVLEYVRTGYVPRLPTAVLSVALMLLAFLSLFSGLILDTVTRGRWELKRLSYLAITGPQGLKKP